MPFGGGDFRGGDRIKRGNTLPEGVEGGLLDGCSGVGAAGGCKGVVRACNGVSGAAHRFSPARRELKPRCLLYTIDMTDSLRTS